GHVDRAGCGRADRAGEVGERGSGGPRQVAAEGLLALGHEVLLMVSQGGRRAGVALRPEGQCYAAFPAKYLTAPVRSTREQSARSRARKVTRSVLNA